MNTIVKFFGFLCLSAVSNAALAQELKIFTANKIITMENALPEATAVAVSDGKIVSVGTLETLQAYINNHGAVVDT
jgi:hypothetical protein